jgi:hypothetical protein
LKFANEKVVKVGTDGTDISNSEGREQRTCGDCELFHKPGCVFPGMNFNKVSTDSIFAIDCRSFTPKKPKKEGS